MDKKIKYFRLKIFRAVMYKGMKINIKFAISDFLQNSGDSSLLKNNYSSLFSEIPQGVFSLVGAYSGRIQTKLNSSYVLSK